MKGAGRKRSRRWHVKRTAGRAPRRPIRTVGATRAAGGARSGLPSETGIGRQDPLISIKKIRSLCGFVQTSGIPVGIVHFLQAAFGELCTVLLKYRPNPDTGTAAKTRAAPDSGHMPVFLFVHDSFRLDDLLPLVFVEGVGQVKLRRLQVERLLPSLPVSTELNLELVPISSKKAHHPPIEIRHLDAAHLFRRTDGAEIVLDVCGQVAGERGEENPTVRQIPREPACTVHRGHCLPGARTAQHPHRSVPVTFHEATLSWMKKHAPVFQRSIEHRFEGQIVLGDEEACARFRSVQSGREVVGIHLLGGFAVGNELFVGLTSQIEEKRLVGLDREPGLYGVQPRIVPDSANLREHGGRDPKARKLAIPQVAKCRTLILGQFIAANGHLGGRRIINIWGLGFIHLNRTGLRVDVAPVALRPRVCVVVLVRPQQNMNVAPLGLRDDCPVTAINAQRTKFPVLGSLNAFVVQAARGRVGVEPGDERSHAPLLTRGQSSECVQKVARHRHRRSGHVHSRFACGHANSAPGTGTTLHTARMRSPAGDET